MAKDYYKILGVQKGASQDDIKKAFRKLAHEFHPDKTKGNETASTKFKEASEAYSVLGDEQKRKQYDTFGSAGAGFNPGGYGGQGGGQGGFSGFNGGQGFGGFDFSQFSQQYSQNGNSFEFDLGDIFGDIFGMGGRRPRRGKNITVDIELTFKDAIFGIDREISNGKEKFSVKIPPGIDNGQALRVAGKGEKGDGGQGDLVVRIWVKDHPTFHKEGYNLIMELPLKLTTALLGGTLDLETLDGKIELKIPAGTTHNEILRVKNKGVPTERGSRGDLLVVTKVNMPKKLSKQAQRLIEELKKEGI